VSLDGKPLALLSELKSPNQLRTPYDFGIRELDAGEHKLSFMFVGESPGGGGGLGVDGVYLRPIRFYADDLE
jgi:hypothetical protein